MKLKKLFTHGDPGIVEAFYSIQGEGPHAGWPTIFIRLSGCGLGCKWCDTTYADKLLEKTSDDIANMEIPTSSNIVITGGEPLHSDRLIINGNFSAQLAFIKACIDGRGIYCDFVEIESAGVVNPDVLPQDIRQRVIYSPKLPHQAKNSAASLKYFKRWLEVCKAIKIVWDSEEVTDFITERFNTGTSRDFMHKLYIMPEGRTAEEIQKKSPEVIEVCKQFGIKYSPRIQVSVYGQKRGV